VIERGGRGCEGLPDEKAIVSVARNIADNRSRFSVSHPSCAKQCTEYKPVHLLLPGTMLVCLKPYQMLVNGRSSAVSDRDKRAQQEIRQMLNADRDTCRNFPAPRDDL
jgi:hypothetical protein